ncbi:MAG: hypothetical protein RQ745_13430 [Longimicrobiales bacterium]|nr:hypothetical protein [Longimicrobiales bacterium]
MKGWTLALLRLSIGLLVFWWGLDKIVAVNHAVGVSDTFYGGLLSNPSILPILGGVQILVALAFIAGFRRGITDWLITLMNAGSMVAVWKSVVDPFGHVLEGTNALFFPALITVAGCLVLIALHDQEEYVLDR